MKRIVVTGGACAGKSTVLAMLREEYGEKIVVVPEAATMLLGSGFPVPGRNLPYSPAWQLCFQEAVCALQVQLEASWELVAARSGARLMVCDRGLLDGAAYLREGFEELLARHGLDRESIYGRYDQVIHLESVATCQPHLFGKAGNDHRYETLEEAQALELRTREAWSGHPAWSFIGGKDGVARVAGRVLAIISRYLDREIERKFWLPGLPEAAEQGAATLIEQGYLVSEEGAELRIRRAGETAWITIKEDGELDRDGWERALPLALFDLLWPATAGARIRKTRYLLADGDRPLEIDAYHGRLEGLVTMEREFSCCEAAAAWQLPAWADRAVEVTVRREFKNKNLAVRGKPAWPE